VKKAFKLVALIMVMVFLFTACGQNIVAEVNGKKITKEELQKKVDINKSMMEGQGLKFDGKEAEGMLKFLEMQVLSQMIQETVVMQDAEKQGIKLDDNKAQGEIDKFKKLYGDSQFKELLTQQKTTEAEFKKTVATQIQANELFEKVTKNVTVTDADLKAYYDKNKNDLTQLKVRHIVFLAQEGKATPEQDKKAKEKAENVLKELKGGADFAELAKKYSEEPAAKTSGGALEGYFSKSDNTYDPLFVEGALKLDKGEYSKEPVKSSFGYHIIKVEDKKDSFEGIKSSLKDKLSVNKKNDAFNKYLDDLMKKAKIKNYLADKEKADEKKQAPAKSDANKK
jgi:parvulin-like peptidyl-prolyl isomerase